MNVLLLLQRHSICVTVIRRCITFGMRFMIIVTAQGGLRGRLSELESRVHGHGIGDRRSRVYWQPSGRRFDRQRLPCSSGWTILCPVAANGCRPGPSLSRPISPISMPAGRPPKAAKASFMALPSRGFCPAWKPLKPIRAATSPARGYYPDRRTCQKVQKWSIAARQAAEAAPAFPRIRRISRRRSRSASTGLTNGSVKNIPDVR